MRPVALLFAVPLLALLLAAADSTAAETGTSTADSVARPTRPKGKSGIDQDHRAGIAQLKPGLTPDEVAKLVGSPERRVRKKNTPIGPVEAWIYHSRYNAGTRNVQTGSTSYQRPNPLTGVMETITDPIMGVEHTFVTEEHVLVFKDGRLVEWKTLLTDRSTTTA